MNKKINSLSRLPVPESKEENSPSVVWPIIKMLPLWVFIATLFLTPLLYSQRLSSGIFRTDFYLIWSTGCLCWIWIGFLSFPALNGRMAITTGIGCGYFFLLCCFKSFADENSIYAFITFLCCIGITLYLQFIFSTKFYIIPIVAIIAAFTVQLYFGLQQAIANQLAPLLIQGQVRNSGSFAGYMAGVIPLLLSGLFNNTYTIRKLKLLLAVVFIMATLLLLCTVARAAIIGSVAGCLVVLFPLIRKWKIKTFICIGLIFILTTPFIFSALYKFKEDSVSGRVTIYKVSCNIIKDYPLTGIGANRFSAVYNNYQAAFFKKEKATIKTKLLAENILEAYNSILQVLVEYGLIGLLFLIAFVYQITKSLKSYKREINKRWIWMGSLGSVVSMVATSLFANPVHVSPVILLLVFHLSVLLPFAEQTSFTARKNIFLTSFIFIQSIAVCWYAINQHSAEVKWQQAAELAKLDHFESAKKSYSEAYAQLNCNGDFLLNYGAEACVAGEHQLSVQLLEKALRYNSTNYVQLFLGDAYVATNQFSAAEKSYLTAAYVTPSHIYPKYKLAQLYTKWHKPELARMWKNNALQFPLKIKSELADKLITELRNEY